MRTIHDIVFRTDNRSYSTNKGSESSADKLVYRTDKIIFKTDKLSREALQAIEEATNKADFIEKAIEFYVKTNLTSQLTEILDAVRRIEYKISTDNAFRGERMSAPAPAAASASSLASVLAQSKKPSLGSELTVPENIHTQTSQEEDLAQLLLEGFDDF